MASEVTFRDLLWHLLCLVLLVVTFSRAEAEVYKWVDERGVVNYGNGPPPAGAKLVVNDRLSVIDLRSANDVAAEAARIRRSTYLGPYPYGAVFVLGEKSYSRPVDDPCPCMTHSIGKVFNAYAKPLPAYGHNSPRSSSPARLQIHR